MRSWDEQEGEIQRHGDEASKKMSGQLIAVLKNHRKVICTVRFSECEPVSQMTVTICSCPALCLIGDGGNPTSHGVCRHIDDRGIDGDLINEEQHEVDVSGANTMHVRSCMHHSLLFLAMDHQRSR